VLFLFLSSTALSQSKWGDDYLIGHFDEGISSTGTGYSNFDCLYGTDSDVFVGFVEHTTEPGTGDLSIIRKSFDNGMTWTRQSMFSGGPLLLFSPSICKIPSSGNILTTTVVQYGTDSTRISSWEYDYSSLAIVGNSYVDYSYPGADLIRSSFAISNNSAGDVWVFAVDSNNWMYLTKSTDMVSWTPSTPVAANVVRPSAAVSIDGNVAVTWIQLTTGDVMCSVTDVSGNFQPAVAVTDNPASMASPVPAWEHIGDKRLGIVWHDETGKSYITVSEDTGATWGENFYIGDGIYPYINNFPGTRRMGICYTTSDNQVMVANAANIGAVAEAPYTARSNHDATLNGPSKTIFGEDSDQLALFFVTPSSEDFYYNNSLFSGIQNPQGQIEVSVSTDRNPVSGSFSVTAAGFSEPVHYRVYSLTGRVVDQSPPAVTGSFTVNGTALPTGIYTVTASGSEKTASCRVIVI